MTISAFRDELEQVRTKKKEFLSQIERIVPWGEWLAMIQPCYYKGERGNKPYPLEIMLRLYLLQNLYDLSDEATVAEAIDSRAFSEFCGVDSSNQVPDGDTLGRFRNLLIRNGLQEKLFAQVVAALMERGLILKKGTIVDSTIISAPSSTKNKEKKRKQCLWRAMIAFCEPPCQLTAQTVCFLRRNLTGTEGLAKVVSNHIIRTTHPPGVSDVLLLGKQELPVGNTAVALPACNESSAICLFRVCYIVNDGFDCGANCPTLSGVQRHQPRGRQMVSPPDMIMKCGLL